ncbi:BTB/POZ and MATH domain-containing protein 1, partial [Dichanthelium oligosanthes]
LQRNDQDFVFAVVSASGHGKPSRSASSIVADRSVGYHDLEIDGCALTIGAPTGRVIKSCPFAVGGHRWRIWFYPNSDSTGYVMPNLVLDEIVAKSVTAQVQFSVRSERCSLSSGKRRRSSPDRPICEPNAPVRAGSGACDITVLNAFRAEAATAAPKSKLVPEPPSELQKHLGDLLKSGRGADVVFELDGGERFPAHRCVLSARSPVIGADLLGAGAREGNAAAAAAAGVVRVEGVDARVFGALLRFAYTDALSEVGKEEEHSVYANLLAAADRFSLERLKLMCANKLCERVDAATVKTTLALAERHRCDGLKEACLDFLADPANLRAAILAHGL